MEERCIEPVQTNKEKQKTYTENIKRYHLAMKYGFYYEAMLIDYAMLEDRLRSFLYHIGCLRTRNSYKFDVKLVKDKLKPIVHEYKGERDSDNMGISSITGKIKIIRSSLRWASETTDIIEDTYLQNLKRQYEGKVDVGGMLEVLDGIQSWCKYRNEVIHGLMNKRISSVDSEIEQKATEGLELARCVDNQIKSLKKGNRLRKNLGLSEK